MNIRQKLLVIQKSVRGFAKDAKGNNYNYVSGSKVISHVRSKMDELGLLLNQEVLSIDNERQDYKTGINTSYEKPKSEILSKVMMRFTWIDCDSDDTIISLFGANGQNDWDKGVGSALTYAERYYLLKFFHIPTDEDDIDNPDRKPTDEDDKKVIELPTVKTLSDKQFQSSLARINKGEKDVIKNIQANNILIPPAQLTVLQSAESNYKPQS